MRKNIVIAVLAVILAGIVLSGALCLQEADAAAGMGFKVITGTIGCIDIVYDVETGVMYTMSGAAYNKGSMTVMVNPDGTPRVWEGFTNS